MFSTGQQIKKRSAVLRIVIFIMLLIWTSSFTLLIFKGPLSFFYPLFNQSCSLVCHQDPLKTYSLQGINMLVCARCAGIYSGALIISFISLFIVKKKTPHLKYLALALIPMLLDVLFVNAGLYNYNKELSLASGFILGSFLFLYILEVLENYIYNNERQ